MRDKKKKHKMDKSELRNRKTPLKNNSVKKTANDSDDLECKKERVERLQNEEPSIEEEHCDNVTKGGKSKQDDDKHKFRSTIVDNLVDCLKTESRFNVDECLRIQFEFDFVTVTLFVVAFWTRIYKLSQPNNVV